MKASMRLVIVCLGGQLAAASAARGEFERSAPALRQPARHSFEANPLATLHVATNGSDEAGTGSLARPYRTVGRAAQEAAPGTDIRIHPGTYAGDVNLYGLAGNATNPIWIRAATATNRPVFEGGSQGFYLSRARHVALQDLIVAGSSANGINCDDGGDYTDENASGFLALGNLEVRDVGGGGNQDGIKLSGIRDFHVYGVEVFRCGGNGAGSGIDMVGCHRGIIEGSRFHELTANAIQAKGGTSDVEIRQNWISDAGHRGVNVGGSTDFEFFRPPLGTNEPNAEARNVRLYANVIVGCTAAVAFVGAVDCAAANNTIVEPTRWAFRILQETTTSGGIEFAPCGVGEFDNNVVYYSHAQLASYANVGPGTDSATFRVRNNLWFAHDQPTAAAHDLPGTAEGNLHGADPLFADASGGDYRIGSESPAAGAGLAFAGARADYDGLPYYSVPSIGAFEVHGDSDGDGLPDAWEMQTFESLAHEGTADPDEDGHSTWREYVAGTHPNRADSVPPRLRMALGATEALSVAPSATGRYYRIERSAQLGPGDWQTVGTQAGGTGGELVFPVDGEGGGYFRHVVGIP